MPDVAYSTLTELLPRVWYHRDRHPPPGMADAEEELVRARELAVVAESAVPLRQAAEPAEVALSDVRKAAMAAA